MASSRREFFRQAAAASAAFLIAGCDWSGSDDALPAGRLSAGSVDDILTKVQEQKQPYEVVEARAFVSPFPADALAEAKQVYPAEVWPLLEAGVIVLDWRCTHLGCRTPFCESSQWFECPCHGAKFNRVGEKKDGPAPRGMDMRPARIENGRLIIDTTRVIEGVPINTDTTGQDLEGPSCI